MRTPTPIEPKPFLKWAGGKGQLIGQLSRLLPKALSEKGKITAYFEPFLGGGALFFWLSSRYDFKKVFLYDANRDIADSYRTIKNRLAALITELEGLQADYLKRAELPRETFFYEKRDEFNVLSTAKGRTDVVRKSALLIFLNKTCYNGLYRVNLRGEFNVPFGRYKAPAICNKANLAAVAAALKNAVVLHADFAACLKDADERSFVYFDPPYRPLSKTANFTKYASAGFDDAEQERLKGVIDKLTAQKAYVMLSNSDPKNYNPKDDFFDRLYERYYIARLKATRMINCDSSRRGEIKEILITNYPAGGKL